MKDFLPEPETAPILNDNHVKVLIEDMRKGSDVILAMHLRGRAGRPEYQSAMVMEAVARLLERKK